MDAMKPSLYLSSKDLKEIKDWKVGETYDLIVSVKMNGSHISKSGVVSGDFEVQNVMSPDKNVDEMDTGEFEDYTAKQKQKMYN